MISNSSLNAGRDIHVGDKIVNIYKTVEDKDKTIGASLTIEKITQVRTFISKNRIKNALEFLLEYTRKADDDLYNQVIQQSQRWNQLQKNKMLGLLSNEQAGIISARIVMSLLNVLNELEELNS